MDAATFVREMKHRGALMVAEEGVLLVRGPSGLITDRLRSYIRENKPAILEVLKEKYDTGGSVDSPIALDSESEAFFGDRLRARLDTLRSMLNREGDEFPSCPFRPPGRPWMTIYDMTLAIRVTLLEAEGILLNDGQMSLDLWRSIVIDRIQLLEEIRECCQLPSVIESDRK